LPNGPSDWNKIIYLRNDPVGGGRAMVLNISIQLCPQPLPSNRLQRHLLKERTAGRQEGEALGGRVSRSKEDGC